MGKEPSVKAWPKRKMVVVCLALTLNWHDAQQAP